MTGGQGMVADAASHVAAMAVTGLAVAVLVPALVLATAGRGLWRRVRVPAPAALPGFVAVHAAVTLTTCLARPPHLVHAAADALLVGAAFPFWLPVAGPAPRLSGAGSCLYLFLAAPALDLPAVGVIATGDSAGGLAMIVSMLPVGLAAAVVTWRWVVGEERDQARALPAG